MEDFVSSPRYRQDKQEAARLMKMRTDSRGSPIRRTFLGNMDQYLEGHILKERKGSKDSIGSPKGISGLTVPAGFASYI